MNITTGLKTLALGTLGLGATAQNANAQEGPKLPPLMVPPAIHAPEIPGQSSEEAVAPSPVPAVPNFSQNIKPELAPAPFELHQTEPNKTAEPFFPNIDGRPLEGGAIRIAPKEEALTIFKNEYNQPDYAKTAAHQMELLAAKFDIQLPAKGTGSLANALRVLADGVEAIYQPQTPVPFTANSPHLAQVNRIQHAMGLDLTQAPEVFGDVNAFVHVELLTTAEVLNEALNLGNTKEVQPTLADPNIKSYQDANPGSEIPEAPQKSVLEGGPELVAPKLPPLPAPTLAPVPESSSKTKFDSSRFQ